MGEVCHGLVARGDRKETRSLTASESADLREDEPHPVARLSSVTQLGDGPLIGSIGFLGHDEAGEVVQIEADVHPVILALPGG
jgi:hypothetical protein